MSILEDVVDIFDTFNITLTEEECSGVIFLIHIGCPISYIIYSINESRKGKKGKSGNCLNETFGKLFDHGFSSTSDELQHGIFYLCYLGFSPDEIVFEIKNYYSLNKIITALKEMSQHLSKHEINDILEKLKSGKSVDEIIKKYTSPSKGPGL